MIVATDKAQRQLAARLRNLEALIADTRALVDAAEGGLSAVHLAALAGTAGEVEVALSCAVDAAAEAAGLVELEAQ